MSLGISLVPIKSLRDYGDNRLTHNAAKTRLNPKLKTKCFCGKFIKNRVLVNTESILAHFGQILTNQFLGGLCTIYKDLNESFKNERIRKFKG